MYDAGTAFTNELSDPDDGAQSTDIVGDIWNSTAYIYNDGTNIYYRIRLDDDPTKGVNNLDQFGWGFLIDTDQDATYYEWAVTVDGIDDEIWIAENTTKTGGPTDKAESVVWNEALSDGVNYQVITAPTSFGGDADYFLEFRYPYSVWLYKMGLDENSVIRYFLGSGTNGQTLGGGSGDLVGTDLYTGLSDPLIPTGVPPSTGSVAFRNSADTGDLTFIYPGQNIYIKVIDNDENNLINQLDTVTVLVNAPSGDSETVTLTETGVDTGIFWVSVPTSEAAASAGDGTLQLSPIETVTVTYNDSIDADLNKDQPRYDYLTAKQSADLEVTKTVDKPTPNVGDTITYTVSVKNNGASNASGVRVEDQLPSGVTNKTEYGDGTYNHVTGIWTVGTINSGSTKTIYIEATVNTGTEFQSFPNTALINAADQYDPVSSNNSDTVSITIQGADLEVTKSVDDPYPGELDYVNFTVTVENLGSNGATDVLLEDILGAGLIFNTSSGDGVYNSSTGEWGAYYNASGMVGFDIPFGTTNTLTISAQISAGTAGTILTNFANVVHSDQADPSSINNSATAEVAVGGTDLEILKSINNSSPNVGDTVAYTLTANNIGPNDATNISARDWLPGGVTHISNTPSQGTFDPGTGIWTIGTLTAGVGNTATLDINATIDAGTGGQTLRNIANITGLDQTDLDSSDDSAYADLTVQSVDISVTKIANTTAPNPGQLVQYTVTATNNGPDNATNVEVYDNISADLDPVTTYPDTGTYDPATDIWSIGSLSNGSTATLVINATAPGTSGQVVDNTAFYNGSSQEDTNSANDSATATITVGGTDFSVTKSADNTMPNENDTVVFTITVTNNGPFDGTSVVVRDTIPSGLTYVGYSADQGTYSTTGGNAYKWQVGDLAVGVTNTLTITVTVDTGTTGDTIRNTARFFSADQTDIDDTNNLQSVDLLVGSTDLSISKSVDNPTPTVDNTVSYTITVTNNGLINATNVDVEDILPAGLTYLIDNSGGFYNTASGLWNVTTPSRTYIMPGVANAVSLIINATVDAGTEGSTIINQARIINATQPDPNSANNIVTRSLVVQTADLSVQKTVDDATPVEGSDVQFMITVTNNGPHDTTGVVVTDLFPSGLTYLNDDSGGLYNSSTGDWTIGALAKLTSATLIINANAPIGSGGLTNTNTAFINSTDISDTNSANDSDSIDVTPEELPKPLFIVTKTVVSYSDPVNGLTNPIAIPGAFMLYTINVTNYGEGTGDSFVLSDSLSASTALVVNDPAGPFTFVNGAIPTSLVFVYASLGNATDSVYFDDGSGLYDYTPSPDAYGADQNVRAFMINFGGTFGEMVGANTPSFDLKFKVRVQ